jgi:glycosyltransferase involved in cell wall biosynthesis
MATQVAVSGVSVVLGVPLYGDGEHLHEALESLLAQTQPGLALVLCDDGPGDAARAIVEAVAGDDPRVRYRRNETRLGLVENWQRTFEVAGELYPEARYFAWASDHDACHRRWAEHLVNALERSPAAVLAYGRTYQFDSDRHVVREVDRFDTAGVSDPRERLAGALRHMRAGDMVYGVYRREPMRRAGVIRRLLLPDRLLLTELSVQGEFLYVPRALRYRRITGRATLARQRASLFRGRAPAYARLPWWFVHMSAFAWAITAGGSGAALDSATRASLIAAHARGNFAFAARSRVGRIIDWGARLVRGGLLRMAGFARSRRAEPR